MRESHNLVLSLPPSMGGGSLGTRLRKSTAWRLSSYNRRVNGFREGKIENSFFIGGGVMVYMCRFNYMYVITTLRVPT